MLYKGRKINGKELYDITRYHEEISTTIMIAPTYVCNQTTIIMIT